MARDHIDIGAAPAEEDCVQVGTPDYTARAKKECLRFIELLRKHMGPELMSNPLYSRWLSLREWEVHHSDDEPNYQIVDGVMSRKEE